tara:strand:+ start:8505 stop:8720 length:216 start_codon:yes stop_codon:yes gene_type:complete
MKYISIPIFIVSFAIGLFFVYTTTSENKEIFVFPNPDNIGKIQYVDKADNCFEFEKEKTICSGKERLYEVQ